MKWLSFVMIVSAGVLYQVFAEHTASDVNPFMALLVTYAAAFIAALILFLITGKGASVVGELKKVNWYSVLLGMIICIYELGFLLAYRYGFSVGRLGPLVSVATMIVLAVVGILLYREKLSVMNTLGLLMAAVGVIMTIK